MDRMKHHYDSAPGKPGQVGDMKGFDPEFTDIVDYILRITYRIWEGKQVGLCYDYYSDDCPVYTLAGISVGAEDVVQNTLNTLAAFPDRTLHADNIIWDGDAENGFHSSHLISTTMTNLGPSDLGAPTGQQATIQVIAHCVCKGNQIIEEWLVRDNYSLAEQLGFDPHEVARRKARTPRQTLFDEWYNSELIRVTAETSSKRTPFTEPSVSNPEDFVIANLQNIWNARMIGDVFDFYAKDARLHGSAGRDLRGHEEIVQFYTGFLGSLANLRVSTDYVCSKPNKKNGFDIAVRWTMSGIHSGAALWGAPTGTPLLIIGENQYHFCDGKIQEEWTVFDELSILVEVYRARLAAESTNE